MQITFLGTGTSQGVPVIGCQCKVCKSNDIHDIRLRSSVLIEVDDLVLVIDSGPDFRQQMLKANVINLDGIIFTHEHKDHMAGLDDVRAYNWLNKRPTDIYAEDRVVKAIKNDFAYAFEEDPYPGVPQIKLNIIDESSFYIKKTKVIPIRGKHLNLPVLGFRIYDFTYLTDFNYISDNELQKIRGSKILVINGLRKEQHISHFNLEEAIEVIQKISPESGYITHISHQLGLYEYVNMSMPRGIDLAYDNLKIKL